MPKQKCCFAIPTLNLKQVSNELYRAFSFFLVSTNEKMTGQNYLEKVSLEVLAELFHLGILLFDFCSPLLALTVWFGVNRPPRGDYIVWTSLKQNTHKALSLVISFCLGLFSFITGRVSRPCAVQLENTKQQPTYDHVIIGSGSV